MKNNLSGLLLISAMVSEYARPEPGVVDHCVRVDDLTFTIVDTEEIRSALGSRLPAMATLEADQGKHRLRNAGY